MLIFRRSHCIHAAYGTVTLYEPSWWPVGIQIEFSLNLYIMMHGQKNIKFNLSVVSDLTCNVYIIFEEEVMSCLPLFLFIVFKGCRFPFCKIMTESYL